MEFGIEVISTSTDCSLPCLMLHCGMKRIIIQCGDGTQRLCGQNKVKLGKVHDILLTRVHSQVVGGLAGMLLTLSDCGTGTEPVQVIGPIGIADYIRSLRYVYKRPDSTITAVEVGMDSSQIDIAEFNIKTVILTKPKDDHTIKRRKIGKNKRFVIPKSFGTFRVENTSSYTLPEQEVVCYFIHAPAKRGKFYPDKAIALGVEKGKKFGLLTKGETVLNVDGKEVTPEMCMGGGEVSQVIAIIDCPSDDYLPSLMEAPLLKDYVKDEGLRFMIHLGPHDVINTESYSKFIRCFRSPHVEHIFFNRIVCENRIMLFSSALIQSELHRQVNPQLYALDRSSVPRQHGTELLAHIDQETQMHCSAGMQGQRLVVHPLSSRGKHAPAPNALLDEAVAETRRELETTDNNNSEVCSVFQLTFLGTGSAIPSKYRNVTSNLLRTCNGSMFLDCGEASCFQLIRRFGYEKAMQMIANEIHLVWISHMHADHHLGMLQLMHLRKSLGVTRPLHIFGPLMLQMMLNEITQSDPSIACAYLFYPFTCGFDEQPVMNPWVFKSEDIEIFTELGIESITCVPVMHCFDAFAAVLIFQDLDHTKIVFSGDCEPSELLTQHGQNACILIHEATFEDEKVNEARNKLHSTISEAIDVGARMNASFTILTHFSQRYPKGVSIQPERLGKIILASDLMTIEKDQLALASACMVQVLDVFEKMAAKDAEENEDQL